MRSDRERALRRQALDEVGVQVEPGGVVRDPAQQRSVERRPECGVHRVRVLPLAAVRTGDVREEARVERRARRRRRRRPSRRTSSRAGRDARPRSCGRSRDRRSGSRPGRCRCCSWASAAPRTRDRRCSGEPRALASSRAVDCESVSAALTPTTTTRENPFDPTAASGTRRPIPQATAASKSSIQRIRLLASSGEIAGSGPTGSGSGLTGFPHTVTAGRPSSPYPIATQRSGSTPRTRRTRPRAGA